MAFEDAYADVVVASLVSGEYDESNDSYLTVLRSLLPPGATWVFEAGSAMVGLLEGMSYSFLRVAQRGKDLLEEFDPRTTFELLTDWERLLALPGDNPSPPTTLALRRDAVWARLLGHGDPNKSFFETIASNLGYTTAYVNQSFLSSFVPGSYAGWPVATDWQYVWEVVTPRGDDDVLLEWSLQNVAPEHTALVMFWSLGMTEQTPAGSFTDRFFDVAYNGTDLWVAVGENAEIQSSPDGVTWTARTKAGAFAGDFHTVGHDQSGLWVIAGTGGEIQTSPDGITWTARTAGGGYALPFLDVEHDGTGLWLLCGITQVQTSPDGITWTARVPGAGVDTWNGVTHDGSQWIIVGELVAGPPLHGRIETSPDGITWTTRTPDGTAFVAFHDIANDGSGRLMLVGDNGGIQTSADGIVWQRQNNGQDFTDEFLGVEYANGRWVMTTEDGQVFESFYGYDWKVQQLGTSGSLHPGCSADEVFMVGSGGKIYTGES